MITNEKKPIISIIVPIYQVEPYLRECLDSILAQSFTNWELLLVDDGSTDGGEVICDEYGAKDPRIRVFHQENRGLSAARNLGIDNARGDYFAMVDADDVLLSRDYFRILYEAIVENDAEVSVCDYRVVRGNGHPLLFDSESRPVTILSGKDVFSDPSSELLRFSSACIKLYRCDCFSHIRYPEGRLMEDAFTFHHLIYPRKRIAVTDLRIYGRRVREDSIVTGTPNALLFQETLAAGKDCIAYLTEQGDEEAVHLAEKRYSGHLCYHYGHALCDGSIDQIPDEIMPDPEDYEARFGYAVLLHLFQSYDPNTTSTQIRSYRNRISKDAVRLLKLSFDVASDRTAPMMTIAGESKRVEDISVKESLSILFHEALSADDSLSAEEHNRHLQYVRHAMHWSILAWNHEKQIRKEMGKRGLRLIPFIPEELMGFYQRPWFREKKAKLYWINDRDLPTLRNIMQSMSFTEVETDPFELERNVEWRFDHRDGTRFIFFTGMPICFSVKHKKNIDQLCEHVLREQRSMTVTEYAIVLTAKLHSPNFNIASTKLRDLLDLVLIIFNTPQSLNAPVFKSMLIEYSLDDEWERIEHFCMKIINDTEMPSYTQDDLEFILDIIGAPMHRLSYFKKRSEYFFREGKLPDPIEYALSTDKKIAYLVNSKVACSSIKASMLKEELSDGYEVHQTYIDRRMNRSDLGAEGEPFFSFSIVRNPFSRLVSCYLNKFSARAIKHSEQTYLRGYLDRDEGFSSFAERACVLPYRLMDRHFRRQYDLIYDENGASRCDYVGCYETLEKDLEPIQEKYGLRKLPHLNSSATENWMDYYSEEIAELVYETFKKDILTFGYENNYRQLLSYLKRNSVK